MILFKVKNNRGESLIMVLVALGISGIIMLATMSMFNSQLKNQKKIIEKFQIIDTKNLILTSLADSSICKCQLGTIVLAPDATQVFNDASINMIKTSCLAGAETIVRKSNPLAGTTNLVTDDIRITSFSVSDLATKKYNAKIQVSFDPNKSSMPFKPIIVDMQLKTDASNKIIDCVSSAGMMNAAPPPATSVIQSFTCDKPLGRKSSRCCIKDASGVVTRSNVWGDST